MPTHFLIQFIPNPGMEEKFQKACEMHSELIDPVTHLVRPERDLNKVVDQIDSHVEYLDDPNIPK